MKDVNKTMLREIFLMQSLETRSMQTLYDINAVVCMEPIS